MSVNAMTEVYGLIGNPVSHSLSPAMHNAAFEAVGLNSVYIAFRVERLEEAIGGMRAFGIRGLNVTVPWKVGVMKYLDAVDVTALDVGAVNTIRSEEGLLKGFNTDCSGAVRSIERWTEMSGREVVILGAGGAGRAVAFGVKGRGAKLTVLDSVPRKAEELAREVGCSSGSPGHLDRIGCDILINATPVGMYPDVSSSPVDPDLLKNIDIVFDVIYNPLKTRLLKDAESRGCRIVNGLDMLVQQGVDAFEIWTGVKPDPELMRKAALEQLR